MGGWDPATCSTLKVRIGSQPRHSPRCGRFLARLPSKRHPERAGKAGEFIPVESLFDGEGENVVGACRVERLKHRPGTSAIAVESSAPHRPRLPESRRKIPDRHKSA